MVAAEDPVLGPDVMLGVEAEVVGGGHGPVVPGLRGRHVALAGEELGHVRGLDSRPRSRPRRSQASVSEKVAMSVQAVRPIEILLVEDDAGDVIITREALEEGDVFNRLNVVGDGVEAMDYLRRTGRYDDAVRPDLVLLDLNLPKRDGRAVLAEVKADPDLRRIPIIVLTTSDREDDVLSSYDLHANAYVTKPLEFDRFVDVVRQVDDFFVSLVRLPAT